MLDVRLSEIAQWSGGEQIGADVLVSSICTDTRKIQQGDLFVAIKGENFDGNQFVAQAIDLGACGAIVNQKVADDFPQIVVKDSVIALGQIAHAWREKCACKVIGVTGSNGKTTVKEMIAAIISQAGTVLKTQGNFNNHIGLPLTLLTLKNERYAVVEMGASSAGEIAELARIAMPDVGVVTNAGDAHLQGFGSRDGVAFAKGELFRELPEDGVAVINADDRYAQHWQAMAQHCQSITFGIYSQADVRSVAIDNDRVRIETPAGDFELNLPLQGTHNILNALAATAVATALGIDITHIEKGLATLEPVSGRLMLKHTKTGHLLIDDTYNANPDSFKVAIEVLKECNGERWLIAGDMAELGDASEALHKQIGEQAKEAGIERVYTYGERAEAAAITFGKGATHFQEQAELIAHLREEITNFQPGSLSLLVKGSRQMRMELVVSALQNYTDTIENKKEAGSKA